MKRINVKDLQPSFQDRLLAKYGVTAGELIDLNQERIKKADPSKLAHIRKSIETINDLMENLQKMDKKEKIQQLNRRYPGAKRKLSETDIAKLDKLYGKLNRMDRKDPQWQKTEDDIEKLLGRKK